MKVFFIYCLKFFISIIYAFCKLFPTKRNKVVFLSRQESKVNLDFKLIEDYLETNDSNIEIVNICKRCATKKDYVKFSYYVLKSLYHIATAKVCVLDTYWPPVSMLNHKKSLVVIQIWHAMGKIKQSGYKSLGKTGGRNPKIAKAMAMHKNYDYVIAGGKEWNKFYCESFNIDESKLVNCGLPRCDYIYNTKDENNKKILERYPEFANKKVLLYAPTFRRGWEADWEKLLDVIDFNKYILIVKSHPNQVLNIKNGIYTCDDFSSIELLSVCDYLITDYSAIAIEAAILNVKTFYFVYDYEMYEKNNGLNINLFDEMPNCVFKDATSLAKALDKEYPQSSLDFYRKKFLPSPLGVSTETIGKLIMSNLEK